MAEVLDLADPRRLGQVRVRFGWAVDRPTDAESGWLRVTTPYSGDGKGHMFTPEVDKLVLRVDSPGCIEGVLNQEELRGRWPAHKRALQQAYGNRPGAPATLLALDQAVKQPEFMRTQLTSNGLYDFLFPGLYRDYADLPLPTTKVLKGFLACSTCPWLCTLPWCQKRPRARR